MHPSLELIAMATQGTSFERDLYLVGGAVRDELLGLAHEADFDLVTQGSSKELAELLTPISEFAPVVYERFGTAMVNVGGVQIELVTARNESYATDSRKPIVRAATLEEDARRRDFTVNTLMRRLHTGELFDPLGIGLEDLEARVLRTPVDPLETFRDDPLRMLRAVRFKGKLGFRADPVMWDGIRRERSRLKIVSAERIRDELVKMLRHRSGADAVGDLMDLGLFEVFAPEFLPMVGCTQGSYHHLDVWNHTLAVVRNAGCEDLILTLSALFHDIGKPATRSIDDKGNIRFFGHELVGASLTRSILSRLKFPNRDVEAVAMLVRNHMRLGSSPTFTPSAARRLIRDLGSQTERLLELVDADANGLKAGVRVMDLTAIRDQLQLVQRQTPVETLDSPLSGEEIMDLLDLPSGREVGRIKHVLTEKVLDGELAAGDKEAAKRIALAVVQSNGPAEA
jgi:poly(A) polymerase